MTTIHDDEEGTKSDWHTLSASTLWKLLQHKKWSSHLSPEGRKVFSPYLARNGRGYRRVELRFSTLPLLLHINPVNPDIIAPPDFAGQAMCAILMSNVKYDKDSRSHAFLKKFRHQHNQSRVPLLHFSQPPHIHTEDPQQAEDYPCIYSPKCL